MAFIELARAGIVIGGDDSPLNRALGRAQQSMNRAGRRMQQIGTRMSLAVTLPIAGIGAAAVKMASDAEESANKFDVVMGSATDRVRERLQQLQQTIPLTSAEMEGMAAGIQDLLVPMGVARTEAADMSAGMVELAGDIASFNNVLPTEALMAMRSALAGESEPMRRFGVDTRVTRLETLALEAGLIKAGEALDETARAQAVMLAVQQDSKDAMGDAARTVDSTANSIKFLARDVKQLGIDFGQVLIPVIRPVLAQLKDMLSTVKALSPEKKRLAVVIAGLAAAAGPVLVILGTMITSLGTVLGLMNPITLGIAAVVTVARAFGVSWREMGSVALGAVEAILNGVSGLASGVRDVFGPMVNWMLGLVVGFTNVVVMNWEKIRDDFKAAFSAIREFVRPVLEGIAAGLAFIGQLGSDVAGRIEEVLTEGADAGAEGFGSAGKRSAAVFEEAFARDYVGGFVGVVQEGVDRALQIVSGARSALAGFVSTGDVGGGPGEQVENLRTGLVGVNTELGFMTEKITEQPDVWGALENVSTQATEAMDEGTQGVIDTIGSGLGNALGDIVTGAKSMGEAFSQVASQIVQGFIRMIAKALIFKALTSAIPGFGAAMGAGGGFGSLLGFQTGGRFRAGRPFVAGEAGPELVIPSTGGEVVPNERMGRGPDPEAIVAALGPLPRPMTPREVARDSWYREYIKHALADHDSRVGRD